MTNSRLGTCAYCGIAGEVTSDHVIPQSLWSGNTPKEAPQVDACHQCNHVWKSEYDTYLRDLLVTDRSAAQSEIVQKIIPKFERAKAAKHSKMARDFYEQGQIVEVQRPSGLHVLGMVSQEADTRTREIMEIIVRGLHCYYFHETLPKESSFIPIRLHTEEQLAEITNMIATFGGQYYPVRDGNVFACSYTPLKWTPYTGVWELIFYRLVVFAIAVNFIMQDNA